MPAQKATSSFAAIAQQNPAEFNNALREVKTSTTTPGGKRLPPGINNGIAQVEYAEIRMYETGGNTGKPYFIGRASVHEPKEFNGQNIDGEHTQLGPEPLCATPTAAGERKTYVQHLDYVCMHIRAMLGIKKLPDNVTPQLLDSLIARINKEKPFIGFKTFVGQKQDITQANGQFWLEIGGKRKDGPFATKEDLMKKHKYAGTEPMTNEMWLGAVRYTPAKPTISTTGNLQMNGVVDESAGASTTVTDTPTDEVPQGFNRQVAGSISNTTPTHFDDQGGNNEALIERARAGDSNSTGVIVEMCTRNGYTQQEFDDANWDDVLVMLDNPRSNSASDTDTSTITEDEHEPESLQEEGDTEQVDKPDDSTEIVPVAPEATQQPTPTPTPVATTDPATNPDEEEEDEEDEDQTPAKPDPKKGDMVYYRLLNSDGTPTKSTKGKFLKPIQCEVVFVNSTKQTVKLKSSKDGTEYKSVPWTQLLDSPN